MNNHSTKTWEGGFVILLFNPKKFQGEHLDEKSRGIMKNTIDFFESKGKQRLKEDDRNRVWYEDLLEHVKENEAFYTFLTPSEYGEGECRFDTWRNCHYNEILSFYGLHYWYAWQVSILGLGPIWMGENHEAKEKAAKLLKEGHVFAFGLSERDHGADIYSTEMTLAPQEDGSYLANGEKYYIGNGNIAEMVSTFGKMSDTGDYVFFTANYKDHRYELKDSVVNAQSYVADFALRDYVVKEEDILSKGQKAWDDALNTVNVGKYNLGWASIGICTHAFYESINHAANRVLYGMRVTDFPHVKKMFTDAYARLVAMKLFALRTSDYMRSASKDDRRYLLYNPTVKMKVTTQGEEVIDLLWDVIAAKGFEKDTYFEMAARDIRALPKLEGTVHVNLALILKFMKNYFFNPGEFPELSPQTQKNHDAFMFDQGPTKGLSKVQFHDYKKIYDRWDLSNVNIFKEQISDFKKMLVDASPDENQQKDTDFLLELGELFTLVVYGQLILENSEIYEIEDELVDQIFDFMVRDFAKFALILYNKPATTVKQMDYLMKMIRKPEYDPDKFNKIWKEHVLAHEGVYEMNP